ncbi:tRNA (adenosine(37)-N6)-threonylcarbamoyltransferase complex ATPase subunit type 1 TsaE [Candidatus Saccharibacteria bacterium]|nr:tRNA (adenosine(37)-N6)-threonylcarbamoyltransferase complex ATPase subunit type 1 TsaE [Candidatus Saccharibacteria bacterium]
MLSTSSDDTELIGENLGARLKGGETIVLHSDLGGGKTTLTRGIVRGAGSSERVTSPTFTVSRAYRAPSFEIMHYDFYRLADAGIMAQEFRESVEDQSVVSIVEWSDVVKEMLPNDVLNITMTHSGPVSRDISCIYPPDLAYLFEGWAR